MVTWEEVCCGGIGVGNRLEQLYMVRTPKVHLDSVPIASMMTVHIRPKGIFSGMTRCRETY